MNEISIRPLFMSHTVGDLGQFECGFCYIIEIIVLSLVEVEMHGPGYSTFDVHIACILCVTQTNQL